MKKYFGFLHKFRRFDFFGHPTTLLYQNDQYNRRTIPGGLFSMLIFLYMMVFIGTQLHKVFNFESCQIDTLWGHLNLTELGTVNYDDTKMNFIYSIESEYLDHDSFDELT